MKCKECKEHLVAYVEGYLDSQVEQQIKSHIQQCSNCRAEAEAHKTLHESLQNRMAMKINTFSQKPISTKVMNGIFKELTHQSRKHIMHKRIAKVGLGLSAAAAIIIVAGLSIVVIDKSATPAYALEQTIQACHSVLSLHIRAITPSHEDQPAETWIEFTENGQFNNMRLNLPGWMTPGSGPREVIWTGNKKQEWLKEKNLLTTTEDKASAAQILRMVENLDPKLAVTRLQEKQEQGKVELEINEPADMTNPIVVTATSTNQDDSPFQRMVLYIDQTSKLVNAIELYKLRNGEYEYIRMLEYYDYNQPIDTEMFMFKDVPDDAEHMEI